METKDFNRILAQELRQWMDQKKEFILVDTLPDQHFEKRHLPGAQNACVFQVTFPEQIAAIVRDRDRNIVVYGSSALSYDAATASEKLLRLGYRNVFALTGGIADWRKAGFPLEGKSPAAEEDDTQIKLAPHSYEVDTEKSVIEWTGRNPNTKHYGSIGLSNGRLSVTDGLISGAFEIDMRSIKNVSLKGDEMQPVLTAHLQSDDFFFVKKFPTATFTIDSARLVAEPKMTAPNLEVEGTLQLRGAKSSLKFPATVNNLEDGAITAEAHFDIDRTRWKIIYGSSRFFEHLGMHLVFDLISIQLRIVAR